MGLTRKDVLWVLKKTAESAIEISTGVLNLLPQLMLKGYVLFNFLITGIVLIAARDLFLWMCPTLLRLTKPIVFYINYMLLFLGLFVDSCITVIDSIIVIVDALKSLFTGKKVHEHL